jgi:type II secretory pathway pseudopilin PulG
MARRRGRNSGNNNSLLFLIIIGILIYLLFPRLQLNQEQNKSQNQISREGEIERNIESIHMPNR